MSNVLELDNGTYNPGAYTYQNRKIQNFLLLISYDQVDKNYIYSVDDNNDATLILYRGTSTNVKVPSFIGEHDEYRVKYIECTCFNYNTNVRSVTIPEGVVAIY